MKSNKCALFVVTLIGAFFLLSVVRATTQEDAALQARAADLALFADMSYTEGTIAAYKVKNSSKMNRVTHLKALEDSGWVQIDNGLTTHFDSMADVSLDPQHIDGELHIKESGFDAHAYINDKTKEIVIAFAGTNPWSLRDDATDAWNHAGVMPKQYEEALMYTWFLKKKYGDEYNITLTGHSLGGAEATFVGRMWNLPTVVFNPDYLGPWADNYSKKFKDSNVVEFVHVKEFAHITSEWQNDNKNGKMENYYTTKVPLNYELPSHLLLNEQRQAVDAHLLPAMLDYLERPRIELSVQNSVNILPPIPGTTPTPMPVSTPQFSASGIQGTNASSLLPPAPRLPPNGVPLLPRRSTAARLALQAGRECGETRKK